MNDALNNKHLLGGLTLRDLKELIEKAGSDFATHRRVGRDHEYEDYERFVFKADVMEFWYLHADYDRGEHCNFIIALDTPVRIIDGNVHYDWSPRVVHTITFGKRIVVPHRLEIV